MVDSCIKINSLPNFFTQFLPEIQQFISFLLLFWSLESGSNQSILIKEKFKERKGRKRSSAKFHSVDAQKQAVSMQTFCPPNRILPCVL